MIQKIEELISQLYDCIHAERGYLSKEALCYDFPNAKKNAVKCIKRREQLIEQLIDCLNEYINYELKGFFIFKYRDAVSYKINRLWHGDFHGYDIYIPFQDCQEYYCVLKMLNDNKNIRIIDNAGLKTHIWLY